MLTVVVPLWDANRKSFDFSRCYDESWVEKLYRGFTRNLTAPFRFVCFTDRPRAFAHPEIEQERFKATEPTYRDGIEIYRIDGPLLVLGLDTVIVGNIDHLAEWVETTSLLGLPRDPYKPARACNGIALAPADHRRIYDDWNGDSDDMETLRRHPHVFTDDLWPGQVVSYKGHVMKDGLGDARIVYFHGVPKAHRLGDLDWVARHWR